MNILFVSSLPFNPAYGGIERVTDILAKALKAQEHHVFYLCSHIGDERKEMLEYDFPVKLYMFPSRNSIDSYENLNYYKSLLNDLSIDIVINQQGINASQNALLTCEKKTISVFHSNPDCYVQSNVSRILTSPTTFLGFIKYIIKLLLYPILSYRLRIIVRKSISEQYSYIVNNSDVVVLLSDRYRAAFCSYLKNLPPKRIVGIPNPNLYPLQSIDLGKKKKIILYVGRLSIRDKSPQRLLKIWEKLYEKFPDWHLWIVGDGPDSDYIEKYIAEKRIERVRLYGRRLDVEEYYKQASIICLTSTFEGWGMALTEGMQFGCIPFTFDNYAAAFDIIDDGINGCLIPAYKLRNYRHRLSEIMNDGERRKAMAIAAHKKSMLFDVENVVCVWNSVFDSL